METEHTLFQDPGTKAMRRPVWCGDDLWATLTGIMDLGKLQISFSFSRAERKIFRKKKPIKVSEWSEKYRVLTMSVLPGVWRNEVTPYLVGIMDAAGRVYVREINICKTPQTGGSEAVHNFVGWCIDRAAGPVLYVYPDEKTAGENSKDRVLPMIQSSPRLRGYFTGLEKDKSSERIKLQHMIVYFGWARSVASIANKPIRYAIADEVDKPGFDAGKTETGPLELIDKRLITYREVSKYFKISTPTLESGNIWKALTGSDVIFDYHVHCPLCGGLQLMDFKGIKWAGGSGADPKQIKNKDLAWYECDQCHSKWNEQIRRRAVQKGVWIARGTKISMDTYLDTFRPHSIGFHIPSWISYFVRFGEIVHAFLLGLSDPEKHQDFLNSFCALPWKSVVIKQEESEILAHKIDLPAGVVPRDAVALTCGIDVQKVGFWFVVKAWTADRSSHLVQYGYLASWENVENLIFNTQYPVEGQPPGVGMGIWRAAMDTGGGKNKDDDWSKTEEIYEWIRINGRGVVFGVKGSSRDQVKKVVPRVIDKMTRGNRVIPGGLVLYFLDTDKFKELFHWQLGRAAGESQGITLHADTGMDYARQILAEQKTKDKTGKVSWTAIRKDNHLFDCEIYAAAAADPEWMPSLSFIIQQQNRGGGMRVISRGVNG